MSADSDSSCSSMNLVMLYILANIHEATLVACMPITAGSFATKCSRVALTETGLVGKRCNCGYNVRDQDVYHRNTGFRDEHHFHLSYASGLDTERCVVHCTSSLESSHTYEVPYDRLVIGVGADSNHFNVPGVLEHAFFLKVKG